MSRKELEQIYYLKKELKMWKRRKAELEADIAPPVKQITGMPFANTNEVNSPTEEKAIRLIECTAAIDFKIEEIQKAVFEAEKFILSLGDSQIRQIVELRCVGCRTWKQIAKILGDGFTSESVRQVYSRFMRELK